MKKDDIKYCIVTEGADFNFPYLRVMLNSLLKHDNWVKDNIVIMTCDLTPLSSHNREILKSISDRIQFVNIDTKWFSNVEFKNRDRNQILLSLYRLNCFNLKTFDVALYISSYSVCVSSIKALFEGQSNISLADTGMMAQSTRDPKQKILSSELNSSVMLISDFAMSSNIFKRSLENLDKIRRLTDKSIDQIIQDSLKLGGIDYSLLSLNLVVKKSRFPDSKFKNYQAIQGKVCIINMDIEISKVNNSNFMFKKINSIWNTYNKQEELNNMISSSKIDTNFIKGYITKKDDISNFYRMKTYESNISGIKRNMEMPSDHVNVNVETSSRIAVFTTLNNGYIKYAITCFESFKRNSKEDCLDFYVFCKDATLENQQKLIKHGINLIHMDLSDKYKIPSSYPYPSECFWIFDCPDILYGLGYSHSIGIDSDTYCNLPLNLSWISDVNGIAGIDRGTTVKKFLSNIGQLNSLNKIFKISEAGLRIKSINTGVLVFNNKYCYETKFSEKIHRIFSYSMDNGIPRKGDDSLFSIFLAIFKDTPIKYIDRRYNDYNFYNLNSIPSLEPIIIHYGKIKPWANIKRTIGKVTRYYFNKWINFEKTIMQ